MPQLDTPSYAPGQVITGTVAKVGDGAIFVQLPGTIRGVIRREWLPEEMRKVSCRYVISRGAEVETTVREIDNRSRHILLNLRTIISDPWTEARRQIEIGSVVRGEVTDMKPYGVFLTLDTGIGALVPVSEIPGASEGVIDRVLTTGDFVEGAVTEIDDDKRQLKVSIRKHLDTLRTYRQESRGRITHNSSLGRSSREGAGAARSSADAESAATPLSRMQGGKGAIKRILVVDDHISFLNALKRWLRRVGYEVETAQTGEQGVALAVSKSFDLILMDYQLPDMTGLEATRQIHLERPGAVVVVITGDERPPDPAEMQDIDVATVVSKFGGLAAIERVIVQLEFEEQLPPVQQEFRGTDQEVGLLQRVSQAQQSARTLRGVLTRMLTEVMASTGAQAGIVFEMAPATNEVKIAAQSGAVPRDRDDLQDLKYSPVRDVIREGESILENRVLDAGKKFSYLLRYASFESCIGIRIEGQHKRTFRYALFLFHSRSDQFTSAHFQQALLTSKIMALAIERDEMQNHRLEMESLAVAGLLSSALLHEINNQLVSAEASVWNLQTDYDELRRNAHRAVSDKVFVQDFGKSLLGVASASDNLRKIADSYLGLIKDTEHTRLDVNQILEQARQVVEPETASNVLISITSERRLPSTWGVASRLERAFVNVMLNAVQLTKARPREEGFLIVKTGYEPQDRERPIKIRFIDTGPGIHRVNFEKIFQRGESTRKGGSGLGLYISRGIVNAMGGRIWVEDSLMFVGSCFLIELPAAQHGENA